MEIIRENNLPIEAACGGCCACATCHVYVDPEWLAKLPAADDDEGMMLDEAFEVQDNSRLSAARSSTRPSSTASRSSSPRSSERAQGPPGTTGAPSHAA